MVFAPGAGTQGGQAVSEKTWGNVVEEVVQVLREHGPMTRAQVQEKLGKEKGVVTVLSRLCTATKMREQRAHIAYYETGESGERSYPRPVYQLGPGLNAIHPVTKRRVNRSTYADSARNRQEALPYLSSVFNVGAGMENGVVRRAMTWEKRK